MLKKILPALLFIVTITATVNGQIKKGAIFLGGNIGFSKQNTKDPITTELKNTNFSMSPAFGKAVKENLIFGFDLNYGYAKRTITAYNEETTNIYGTGIFVRKYKELGKGFYLFGQGRAGGSYSHQVYKTSQPAPPVETITNGYSIDAGIYPGIAYAVSNKLQLETGFNNLVYVNYNHQSNPHSDVKTNGFAIGSSLSNFSGLTVGFRILLN